MFSLLLSYFNVVNAVTRDLCSGFKILWYQIESVLGRGGFGITYLARDENLGQLVAIKEYLPFAFAARSGDSTVQPTSVEKQGIFSLGLERFMSEAQMLAKFKHPNIVRVLSVFKHNNTGYMVMEYERGETLSGVYKRKKKLKQHELEDIFYPIIDGLSYVHKAGFIHRDIKPSNIYIRSDGSPVLIDFGAARQAIDSITKPLTSMFSVGYTPFEQYHHSSDKQGAWTDVYALCATMYQGITGEKPQESTIRGMALLHHEPDPYKPLSRLGIKSYTPAFLQTIDRALMLRIYDRPQTLDDFLGMLKGDIGLSGLPAIPRQTTNQWRLVTEQ
jgi:serine/threonine protein kinase